MVTALKTLPFENRWTSGDQAMHWYMQLEREGPESVSLQHAMHDVAAGSDSEPDIPREFISAWLAYRSREMARRTFRWRCVFLTLVLIAAIASIIAAWYGVRAYEVNSTRTTIHNER
jgi:hypothetical protein